MNPQDTKKYFELLEEIAKQLKRIADKVVNYENKSSE